MIDASSGGALMNKTPEESWEMIEIVADSNQHFSTRAKSKGVHEVSPSESTMLAKNLAEMVAMVKEIKEGQQAYAAILKQSPDISHLRPTKHCWRDNQPVRSNLPQQQQGQQRQPYTYSQPQNNQNTRYHPPHNRQQPPLASNPPLSYEEAIRISASNYQPANSSPTAYLKSTPITAPPKSKRQHKCVSKQEEERKGCR
ncbi:hypothetical protein PIB30_050423 [Stylosanthes scabra]|uniref:Uncharacterized protein n=1 Tax=Stylosanthes scabra TaxID=79078 RepID=A0ABU6YF19_9FABA|nr:hypothetical protein [Stylosanthes scabra]